MSDWPEYVSHKKVRAAKIVGIRPADENGVSTIYVRPAGEEYDGAPIEDFEPTRADMKSAAEIGAYAVIYAPDEKYPDGYRSISPAQAFEDGYRRVPDWKSLAPDSETAAAFLARLGDSGANWAQLLILQSMDEGL